MKSNINQKIKSFLKVIQLHNNESTLIQSAVRNDREAQRVLYDMYAPKMLSVCRYYIKDMQHAEEAMLNGFFKVFKNLENFRFEGSFQVWVRRIMVRESISFLRQQRHIEFPVETVEYSNDYDNTLQINVEVDQLQHLIDSLPEGYKMVFIMYAIEGYKHHEIASMLQITEGTSKSQLFKARKMLQEKLQELNKTSYGTK